MPAKTYMVIDPRRDHSLRVPSPALSARLGTPNACNNCHADRSASWAAARVREWFGRPANGSKHFGEILEAGRRGTLEAEKELAELALEPSKPAIVRASAFELLRNYPGRYMMHAIQGGVMDEDPLVRAAALQALEQIPPQVRFEVAFPRLSDPIRAVRIAAARVLAPVPDEELDHSRRSILATGFKEYVEAELVNAAQPGAHMNLGTFYMERRRFAESEKAYRKVLQLAPGFVPALVNLADLYRVQGRDGEGEQLLRQALRSAADNADIRHALGLLLVRKQNTEEAIGELEAAARLSPDTARYSYVYGVALNSVGEAERAMNVLELARKRHPGNRSIVTALISISRDLGYSDRAIQLSEEYLRRVPEDPAVQQLLRELRARQ